MKPTEQRYRLALRMLTDAKVIRLPPALGGRNAMPQVERVRRRHGWLTQNNISGFGVGEKIRDGRQFSELALRVYVVRKVPKQNRSRISRESRIPERINGLPGLGEIQTDVIELGRVELQVARGAPAGPNQAKYRPAPPGSCVGTGLRYGTFGCLVKKKGVNSQLYVLSNNHVIANSGLAATGAPVKQPSPAGAKIANLTELIPFQFSDYGFENLSDAAIAQVGSTKHVTTIIRLMGVAPLGVNRKITRGMQVKKVGIGSELTYSEVLDVDFRTSALYTQKGTYGDLFRAGFRDQVLCRRFTELGDSGSLVLDQSNRAVGLHFAATPNGSIFNKFGNIMRQLNVELA